MMGKLREWIGRGERGEVLDEVGVVTGGALGRFGVWWATALGLVMVTARVGATGGERMGEERRDGSEETIHPGPAVPQLVSRTPREGALAAFAEVMRRRSPERLWLIPGERRGGETAASGPGQVGRRLAEPEELGALTDRDVAPARGTDEDGVDRAAEDPVALGDR
jgi:hypothetical protein